MPSSYEIAIILKAVTGEARSELKRATDDITRGAKETSLAFGAIAAAGTALIAKTVLTAARTEELGVVIENLGRVAGYTEEELAFHEKAIKDLGITTQGARTIMSRFMGAELDLADAAKIARAAQDLAVIGMQDSSEAAETLTYALASMEPRVLRQYGLFVNLNDVYEQTAMSLGKTVEELTETEKRQGMLNTVLEQAGNFAGTYEAAMETSGKQLRSFRRYTEEISNEFGEYFLPYLEEGIGLATDFAKAFLDAEDATKKGAAQIVLYGTAAAAAMSSTAGLMVAGKALIPMFSFLAGPGGVVTLAAGATALLTMKIIEQRQAMGTHERELMEYAETVEDYVEGMKAARLEVYGMTGVYARLTPAVREHVEAKQAEVDAMTWMLSKAEGIDAALRKEQDEYAAAAAAAYRWSDAIVQAASEAEKSMALALGGSVLDLRENIEAYNDLKNAVTTVYADTQGITEGFNDWRENQEASLQERLVALEQNRAEKIAWVQAGAHARTHEQNQEALGYWNAIYDEEKQKLIDTVNEKIGVREEEKNQDIAAAQAAAAEKSRLAEETRQAEMEALRQQQQERLALFAFEMLEHKGLLKVPLEGYEDMEVSAQEYFDLVKAGVFGLSSDITREMGGVLTDLDTQWQDMATTSDENMALLALRVQTVSQDVMDLGATTDTESSAMKQDIERIEAALKKSEGRTDDFGDAIQDTGTDMGNLEDTATQAHNQMQKETKESTKEMQQLRQEIWGAIEAYKRLQSFETPAAPAPAPLPGLQAGMPYVPRTMPVVIHEAEAVLNPRQADQWRRGGDFNVYIGEVYGMDGAGALFEDMLRDASRYAT